MNNKTEQTNFQVGDVIAVRDSEEDKWLIRRFVIYYKVGACPFIVERGTPEYTEHFRFARTLDGLTKDDIVYYPSASYPLLEEAYNSLPDSIEETTMTYNKSNAHLNLTLDQKLNLLVNQLKVIKHDSDIIKLWECEQLGQLSPIEQLHLLGRVDKNPIERTTYDEVYTTLEKFEEDDVFSPERFEQITLFKRLIEDMRTKKKYWEDWMYSIYDSNAWTRITNPNQLNFFDGATYYVPINEEEPEVGDNQFDLNQTVSDFRSLLAEHGFYNVDITINL